MFLQIVSLAHLTQHSLSSLLSTLRSASIGHLVPETYINHFFYRLSTCSLSLFLQPSPHTSILMLCLQGTPCIRGCVLALHTPTPFRQDAGLGCATPGASAHYTHHSPFLLTLMLCAQCIQLTALILFLQTLQVASPLHTHCCRLFYTLDVVQPCPFILWADPREYTFIASPICSKLKYYC